MRAMNAIDVPGWARPPTWEIDASLSEKERRSFEVEISAILTTVEEAVQRYIDDPKRTFDSGKEGFPSRDRLSGEFYISCVSCRVLEEPWFERVGRRREVRVAVMCHCLEHAFYPGQVERDYLGLEVHFSYDASSSKFVHFGDVDSSTI